MSLRLLMIKVKPKVPGLCALAALAAFIFIVWWFSWLATCPNHIAGDHLSDCPFYTEKEVP